MPPPWPYTSESDGATGYEAYERDLQAGLIDEDGNVLDTPDVDAVDNQRRQDAEDARSETIGGSTTTGTSTSTEATTTTSRSTRRSRTTGRDVSVTEQLSRRFIDVPTKEKFLDDFQNAFSGFAQGAIAAGMSGGDLNDMMSQDFVQMMMSEYMGNLAERAARGEDIFELVGTEEDFRHIRTEPGTESTTRGRSTEETRSTGEDTSESVSRGRTGSESEETSASETTEEGTGGRGSRGRDTSTQTGTSTSTRTSRGTETGLSTSERTRESRFRERTEVLSRPEISAVYKFSPTDFLAGRFGKKMDEATLGRLSTEIRASAAGKRGGKTGAVSARRA